MLSPVPHSFDLLARLSEAESRLEQEMDDLMGTVFELVVKEGVFSYTSVHAEVLHFFKVLRFHETLSKTAGFSKCFGQGWYKNHVWSNVKH